MPDYFVTPIQGLGLLAKKYSSSLHTRSDHLRIPDYRLLEFGASITPVLFIDLILC